MRFRLLDRDERKVIHEGVMPVLASKRPEIVTWGNRAFLFEYMSGEKADTPVYAETSAFRIGSFGR